MADREDHPAHRLARSLAGSAEELRSYLSSDFPWSLGYADYAELLPGLEDALHAIGGGIEAIREGTHNADETTYMRLSEASKGIAGVASSLFDVRDWYVSAAREAEAQQASWVGRAAETAWNIGAEHGRGGGEPAVIHEGEDFYWNGEHGEDLAAALGIRIPPADAIVVLSDPDHEEVAVVAGAAYCDAYAEAAGLDDPWSLPGRYLAGQPVTTALGRAGTLTGGIGHGRNPRVRFGDGQEETVPREAVSGPVGHVFATREEAARAAADDPGFIRGDIAFVQSDGSAWVHTRGGLQPADEKTAALDSGRYKASVHIAMEQLSSTAAGRTAGGGDPASSPARIEFLAAPSAAARATPGGHGQAKPPAAARPSPTASP